MTSLCVMSILLTASAPAGPVAASAPAGPASAPAAGIPVRALTIDGESIDGTWSGVNETGAILLAQDGKTTPLPADRLMMLQWRAGEPADTPAAFPAVVHLTDGSRLFARITGGDTKHLAFDTAPLAGLTVPLTRLAAIRFARDRHDAAQEAFDKALRDREASQDVLLIVRGDQVTALRGVTESLSPAGGTFQWRSRSVPIDPQQAYGLVLAAGVHDKPVPQAVCALRDGSAWAGRLVGGNADHIKLDLTAGRTLNLPTADLAGIRFHSDRVVFLSDLEPAEYTFEPFGVTRWPYRRDRSAANRPLRIGDQTFERGLGMHARSWLAYDLTDRFTHLAAVIGIDEGAGAFGNAIFRVIADGREVFNSGPVTGRDDPKPILVPIDGARRVELHADFGDDLDIGDQADWASARLIK